MADMDALRERITAAIDGTIDRCARCKVCEVQIDAVMTILREAGVLPEGAVTEWGVRLGVRHEVLEYDDEEDARVHRDLHAGLDPSRAGEVVLVSRQTWATPWTEVPAPETEEAGDDG